MGKEKKLTHHLKHGKFTSRKVGFLLGEDGGEIKFRV
jgi:hypothetical protein